MNAKTLLAGVVAGAWVGCASATPSSARIETARAPFVPDSGTVAIRCGALIDGLGADSRKDLTIVVRDGRILTVEPTAATPAGLPLLDLSAYTCLPGLIDLHTHLTDRPEDTADLRVYYTRTAAQTAAQGAENAQTTLSAGFTTVRNVGVYAEWTDRALRDAIDRGEVAGPRMQICGYYLTVPGGGGDLLVPDVDPDTVPARFRAGVARGEDAFRAKALAAVAGGADVLKVIASGAVLAYGGVPGAPEMSEAEIAAVVQVAHAAGIKVAAHAHGAESIKQAIRAGADTIEHASLIDAEAIALARDRDVALSMDVYNGDYIDTEGRRQHWPEEFLRKNVETTEAQRHGFTRALASGVPIVFGSDAGVFPHGLQARQFPIMVARGMTPMQAIQSATSVAARYLGWSDRVGAIAPGRFADLIAVRGDPLADIEKLQEVAVVVRGGLVFKQPEPAGAAPP
jgi:imidazolonepropionase-like amidohydrolase